MALHDIQAGGVSCDAGVSYELQRSRCFSLKCICRACEAVPMGMVLAIGNERACERPALRMSRGQSALQDYHWLELIFLMLRSGRISIHQATSRCDFFGMRPAVGLRPLSCELWTCSLYLSHDSMM